MKKTLLKGIQNFIKNLLLVLREFGKGAGYAINH
ncbi:hypothetical protein SAMN04487765_1448 [Tenacibaculum sp. MAR_2010_89]|nr:hypothetical protein SAMN04487765_1448 [Tenacibaculum sp. MAR_2010_89]